METDGHSMENCPFREEIYNNYVERELSIPKYKYENGIEENAQLVE